MIEQFTQPLVLILLAIIVVYTLVIVYVLRRMRKAEQEQAYSPLQAVPAPIPAPVSVDEERFLNKADEAKRLTQTFQKFVPKQFVDHFAKHGSDTLELGRADEDDVAILFCDIRGFTSLSERMTPQELMKFLNSYFLRMNDPIHQNGGFIDKFIGDAIMALFDNPSGTNADKAQDAIKAAIDLRAALNIYNQHRSNSNYPPIDVGIGIHFGPVIIGTVGSDDRMDTTVIGDSVNIAYRIEGLAPKLGADIIVTSQLLETAKAKGRFTYRILDWVKVKGREQPVEIYELLDHLPAPVKKHKLVNSRLIEKGIKYRIKRDVERALECFQLALNNTPDDPLIIHHIEQCHKIQERRLPEDWDGAIGL